MRHTLVIDVISWIPLGCVLACFLSGKLRSGGAIGDAVVGWLAAAGFTIEAQLLGAELL